MNDPFLGSGTSLIAAEMTGRTCIGLEISQAYTHCEFYRLTLTGLDLGTIGNSRW